MPLSEHEHKGDVMVVDDQPANLKLLEDLLRNHGYRVRSFPRGRLAVSAAQQRPPDLILLDINMPEMNGYEVCARLKELDGLREVPVIFLSALNETSDKLKAFESGAVDYISKPFQFDEVRARVEAHTQLHNLQRSLRAYNERLEELVAIRTRELAGANARLQILDQAKSDFLNLISHELRTPLNGLLGITELLLEEADGGGWKELFEQSRRRILTMLDDAAVLSQIEVAEGKFHCERLALHPILSRALEQSAAFAQLRQVRLEPPATRVVFTLGVERLLVKALQSLIETAVRFSNPGSSVVVASRLPPEAIQVVIQGHGRALPEEVIPKFFDLLAVGEAITSDGDFGLGPAVAHRILALFGGSVTVENLDPPAIQLKVSLKPGSL
jgi:DNA-binding response OmpR family regulator